MGARSGRGQRGVGPLRGAAAAAALCALCGLAPATPAQAPAQAPDSARGDSARRAPARREPVQRLGTVTVTAERPASVLASPLLQQTAVGIADSQRVVTAPSRILPDVLRELPGVQVQQTNAGHGTVILRGMTGNQVLVLVDGVRLNTATVRDGPNQYLATIDPERIARVEVIRGPGSVLYGSDAMGGVVNVVTKRPGPRAAAAAALSYAAADDGVRAHAEGTLAGARLRARGGATVADVGALEAGGDQGAQPATGYRSLAGDVAAELALRPCETLGLSVQGMALRDVSRFDRLVAFRAPAPGPDAEFAFDPQTHLLGVARYDGADCPGAARRRGVAAGAQAQREGRRQRGLDRADDGTLTPSPVREYQRDDTRTLFLTAFVEPRGPALVTVRVGADLYDDRVASFGWAEDVATGARTPLGRAAGGDTIPAGRFPDGARSTALGAYAHAAWIAGARTRLLGGARADLVRVRLRAGDDYSGDVDARSAAVTGQLGVERIAGRGLSLGAHVGQGFRAPNIYDLSTVSRVPGGVVLPSAGLDPERSLTYELSARAESRRGAASVAAFLTDVDGFVDRVPGSFRGDTLFDGQRVFRAANVGTARIGGVEAAAEAAPARRWTARAHGFWTRGTQHSADGGREPVGRIPPLSGTATLRRDVAAGVGGGWVELVARAAGPQRQLSARDERDSRIQPGGTPGYATLALRASLARGRARVSLGVENVLDRLYREHGSGIDAPGRHVWVRVDVGT